MLTSKTFRPEAKYNNNWYIIDAKDQNVGRLATKAATILMGKNLPTYSKDIDCGAGVIVINAESVNFTGKKWDNKIYYKHTGYVGGLKKRTAKEQLERDATQIIMSAVKGMLPKNKLANLQLGRLRVFNTDDHQHQAQAPIKIEL